MAAAHRVLAAIGLLIAAAVFLPPQITRARYSADRFLFNDDARQWAVPFFGGALRDDWTSTYYRAITPIGQRALYTLAGTTGGAEPLSKVLPYVLFALACLLVAATTSVLAGSRTAAVFSVCFLFSTAALMARMTGGGARAFAFPILAAVGYGLASGRMRIVALATLAGAAFYPPAGVLAGVALALSIRARRDIVLVAATAILSAALLLPLLLSGRAYGRAIAASDLAAYPEAGPKGRYSAADRPPFPPILTAAYRSLDWGLKPAGARLVPPSLQGHAAARAVVLALAAFGLLVLARSSPGARRLLLLPAGSLLLYGAAVLVSPGLFIPTRYVSYSLVLLPAIAIPVAAFALAQRTGRTWPAIAICTAILLFLGGTGSPSAGLTVNARHDAALYEHLARMPELKLAAGWPIGPIDNVPYLSRKPALVTYETHAAFHTGAVDVMRKRMLALIDAYFATSPEPLMRLRDSFGVTHLLVDRRHFAGAPPRYFAPFDEPIETAARRLQGRTPEVVRQAEVAAVLEHGPYVLLDLRRLRAPQNV